MIVLIRCNDMLSDSRAKKYLDFYQKKNIDYRLVLWDRLGTSERLPNALYCPVRSQYNQGGVAAIKDRLKWMWFIFKALRSFRENLEIHACDLDAAFPATVYKMLSHRKTFLLFDVFDWISDTLNNQGRIVSMAFSVMERFSTAKADHIVICEPERIRQIPYDIKGRYSVLQNIPAFDSTDFLYHEDDCSFDNSKLTLTYVGSFTDNRCLAELIDGAASGCYNLNIAGYGSKDVTDKLEANAGSPYIHYFGKVDYKRGLRIMYSSDIIYAMYSKYTPNHIFAAPNKYYEAMFVGKPIITTKGIIVADKAVNNGFGYDADESLDAIKQLVGSLTKEDVERKARVASVLWSQYKDSTDNYLNTTYSDLMKLK